MKYETRTVNIKGRKLTADVADTMRKRAKGLSGRASLKKDECMLFVFPFPGTYPIWMRGMKFPIDVLWLDEKKHIIDLKENLKQASGFLDFKTYRHKGAAKYAIELNSGFMGKNNVKTGDKVDIG